MSSSFFADEPDWYRAEAYGQSNTATEPPRVPSPATGPALRIAVALIERDLNLRDRLAAQLGQGVSTFGSIDEL